MNCLEFRQRYLTAPRAHDADMHAHQLSCPSCAAFAVSVDRGEQILEVALRVTPSEGLANRILLRQALAETAPLPNPARRRFLALAASGAAVATGLGVFSYRERQRELGLVASEALQLELLQHLATTHPAGMAPAGSVQLAQSAVAGLMQRAGFSLREPLNGVANGWPCALRNQPIVHLALTAERGIVSAVCIAQAVVTTPRRFVSAELDGLIVPCARGCLALVAEHPDSLENLAQRLTAVIV